MDALQNIFLRRSIRQYSDRPISDEDMKTILGAAMAAPSCANTRDWSFIVVRDRDTLNKMADANGKYAQPLRNAAAGILVLGDVERAFELAKDYWIVDGAIAAENLILAANALGIGSVWLGTYPQMERVEGLKELFSLPEGMIPHSVIALGYPADESELTIGSRGFYEEDRVHFERW